MDEIKTIDASAFLYMPLSCLCEIVSELDSAAPGTAFVITVIRYSAFLLIAGSVESIPGDKISSARRGFDMLEILRRRV